VNPPKARVGNVGRPTLSESIRFVSDRLVGSNKAVWPKLRAMLNRRRLLRDEERWQTRPERKMEGGPERRSQRETNQYLGWADWTPCRLIAIPAVTRLPDIHPRLPDRRVWPDWNQFHLSITEQPRTKKIAYPVVIRTRSIIEILPHNSAPGLLHHASFYSAMRLLCLNNNREIFLEIYSF